MKISKLKTPVLAVSTLAGTIIGVGFFSLPYITTKVGAFVMLAYFLVVGALVALVHLFFAEVTLNTPDYKRLPGFAEIYLGKWAKQLAIVSMVFGSIGSLLAYLVVGGGFLSDLLTPIFGGLELSYILLYFFLGAIFIFLGIRAVSRIEFFGLVSFLLILFSVFLAGLPHLRLKNIPLKPTALDLFLPYGPILFSLWGASLMPEIEEILKDRKKLLKKVVVWGILISVFIYLLFTFFILGVSGENTTESALGGLGAYLGGGIVSIGLVFGILTTFTSFIAIGLTLRKILDYDLKMPENLASFITCMTPLVLLFLGMNHFISIISFVGGFMLGIEGLLILLMYLKIRPEKKAIVLPLVFVFLAGIIYQIIYFIK